MSSTVRVVHVEDQPTDAELLRFHLRRATIEFTIVRVETEAELVGRLEDFSPDLVISDYSLPSFSGLEALEVVRRHAPDVPFVFMSGTIREEVAIEALKAGAADYILKNNLNRLVPAIERALRDARQLHIRREMERERTRLEAHLRSSEAALRRAQSVARLAHIIVLDDGRFQSVSETLAELLGLACEKMPQNTSEWLQLVHPEDIATLRTAGARVTENLERADVEYRLRRGDSTWSMVRQVMEPMDLDATGERRWFSTIQDITAQKQSEEKIRRLNRVYAILSGINNAIARSSDQDTLFSDVCRIAVDEGHFSLAWIGLVDEVTRRLSLASAYEPACGYLKFVPLGLDPADRINFGVAGLAVLERRAIAINDIAIDDGANIPRQEALRHGFHSFVVLPLLVGGKTAGVLALYCDTLNAFDAAEMTLLQEMASDVAYALRYLKQADRLEYLAYYDPLTGLANRRLFSERLAQYVVAAATDRRRFALIAIDIARFRTINDAFGRQVGDLILMELATRAARTAERPDLLARVGADHFVAVIPEVMVAEEVGRHIERCMTAILGPAFDIGDEKLRITGKAGVAIYPEDGTHADSLLMNVEVALKRCKNVREPYLFFSEKMTERVAENLLFENRLRRAVENNEFVLYYQPKIALATRKIIGAEALLRWRSPEHGLVPPVRFIQLLEDTGLIVEVGRWALQQAAIDFARLARQGLSPPRIAVNVSPLQLRDTDFVATVGSVLSVEGTNAGIDLEITESIVLEDMADTIAKLKEVRELGVSIAIDDFGTGYSSLSYLAKLPVQTLKIDRSFIITMLQEPDAMMLVTTMISLAHSLRMSVVAEGVDDEEQAKILRVLGCDQMQGYLFSEPLPVNELATLLEAHRV